MSLRVVSSGASCRIVSTRIDKISSSPQPSPPLVVEERGFAPVNRDPIAASIRIDVKAGHGAGKPTAKVIEEAADRWAFLVKELGMNPSF